MFVFAWFRVCVSVLLFVVVCVFLCLCVCVFVFVFVFVCVLAEGSLFLVSLSGSYHESSLFLVMTLQGGKGEEPAV